MVKSLVFSLEYCWNNNEITVLFLIPLTFSKKNSDIDKSLKYQWKTLVYHWYTTVIPETFSMGHNFHTLVGRRGFGVAPITQVTHMHNKKSNIQGRSLNVIKVIFHTIRNCS